LEKNATRYVPPKPKTMPVASPMSERATASIRNGVKIASPVGFD
jgi:hypothetical protein